MQTKQYTKNEVATRSFNAFPPPPKKSPIDIKEDYNYIYYFSYIVKNVSYNADNTHKLKGAHIHDGGETHTRPPTPPENP